MNLHTSVRYVSLGYCYCLEQQDKNDLLKTFVNAARDKLVLRHFFLY